MGFDVLGIEPLAIAVLAGCGAMAGAPLVEVLDLQAVSRLKLAIGSLVAIPLLAIALLNAIKIANRLNQRFRHRK